MIPPNHPDWKIKSSLTLSPAERRVLEYIRNEAEDSDSHARFSRASTLEVARALNISPDVAYRALASLARRKIVSKAGRVPLNLQPSSWSGPDTKAIGWQLWEAHWDQIPEDLITVSKFSCLVDTKKSEIV